MGSGDMATWVGSIGTVVGSIGTLATFGISLHLHKRQQDLNRQLISHLRSPGDDVPNPTPQDPTRG